MDGQETGALGFGPHALGFPGGFESRPVLKSFSPQKEAPAALKRGGGFYFGILCRRTIFKEKSMQKKKSESVNIKSFQAFVFAHPDISILGLGDDNKTYLWSYIQGCWLENWESPEEKELRTRMQN